MAKHGCERAASLLFDCRIPYLRDIIGTKGAVKAGGRLAPHRDGHVGRLPSLEVSVPRMGTQPCHPNASIGIAQAPGTPHLSGLK